jgi:hypothetical protein
MPKLDTTPQLKLDQLTLLTLPPKPQRKRKQASVTRHFVSFGGGVQSTALFLLIKNDPDRVLSVMGALPEAYFFADTGAEPEEVYAHIERLRPMAGDTPIVLCKKDGPTMEEVMLSKNGSRCLPIPAFTKDSVTGRIGMTRRQCTREYKIAPLQKAMRDAIGARPRAQLPDNSIHSWIGISTDEAGRVKDSGMLGITNRYPLLEMGLSREDCKKIISDAGLNPVKSRCYFCPYINDWDGFKADHPQAFDKAVEMDRQIRDSTRAGVEKPVYLRRDCLALDGSDDRQPGPLEAIWKEQWEDQGFEDECDGMCGL